MSLVFKPSWQAEGKGATVLRVIGNKYLQNLDPFLLLDFFKVKLPAGFPDHPHRGFETVTYMLEGNFYHEDFRGHKGKIGPGDLQWMTAGKGIVHSEIPASWEEDALGFQLWINLDSKSKLIEPAYQEYTSDKIQIIKREKVDVKIISGKWEGLEGPIYARTPSYYFDVTISSGGEFVLPIPGHWNSIIYVFKGNLIYQENIKVDVENCCVLEKDKEKNKSDIIHKFKSTQGARFVLIGGQPLNQPIKQYGPFVMNTEKELEQAVSDFQNSRNGFQGAQNWQSKIKQLIKGKKIEQI